MVASHTTQPRPVAAAALTVLLQHLVTLINHEELELLEAEVLLRHQLYGTGQKQERQCQHKSGHACQPTAAQKPRNHCKHTCLAVAGAMQQPLVQWPQSSPRCCAYLLDPARCADHNVWALVLVLEHVLLCLDVHAAKEVANLDIHGLAKALKLATDLLMQGAQQRNDSTAVQQGRILLYMI